MTVSGRSAKIGLKKYRPYITRDAQNPGGVVTARCPKCKVRMNICKFAKHIRGVSCA